MPRIDPVYAVVGFIIVGTFVVWSAIVLAGPGRSSDPVVLAIVAAPVLVAIGFGWYLSRSSET